MKRLISMICGAAMSLVAVSAAQAADLSRALSIVIDGSGSIDSTDFQTQKDAYVAVLGDASVLVADGSVAVNVIQFSSFAQIEQSAIRINNETDRTTLLNSISTMTQLNGLTAIGDGTNLGRSDMEAFLAGVTDLATDFAKIIDVSTDGFNNTGANPNVASDNAGLDGYTVNCLAIGVGSCSFNDGEGIDFQANTFADLQPVLEDKIRLELGTIPVPASLALLSLGLIGFGAAIRRRSSALAA